MTPDQITQLRQSAEQAKEIIEKAIEWAKYPQDVDLYCNNALDALDRILDLLPCPTCNGMEIMMRCVVEKTTGELLSQDPEPCSDCQPRTCVCCEEVTKENAHLHRNCGK